MANDISSWPEHSGDLAADDLLPVVDVSEADPMERRKRADVFFLQARLPAVVTDSAPSVDDDETLGYRPGHEWLDTSGPTLYMCTDATEGAAVWRVLADWS